MISSTHRLATGNALREMPKIRIAHFSTSSLLGQAIAAIIALHNIILVAMSRHSLENGP